MSDDDAPHEIGKSSRAGMPPSPQGPLRFGKIPRGAVGVGVRSFGVGVPVEVAAPSNRIEEVAWPNVSARPIAERAFIAQVDSPAHGTQLFGRRIAASRCRASPWM